jgi:asparagine synthase (glutamine-hydrolysing)
MCGICGILQNPQQQDDPQSRQEIVQAMMQRLVHRGPDGEGLAEGRGFTIGHRRLAIIDIEHGAQPMWSQDHRYVLSFNGEIYNYLELRQQLIQDGKTFRTSSDTEVLLEALIDRGCDALNDLNGMFAFAFLDTHTGKWLLARDCFGIKPLYLAPIEGQLLFASEIKALLVHPALAAEVNWRAMQHYLTFQFFLHGESLFKHVISLEPGCLVEGQGGKILTQRRYWDCNYEVDTHHTDAYFEDQLLQLLGDSARLQIRSDVPLGAYLSGGVDSSTVSALAGDHLGRSIPLFHGRFEEGPTYDESRYARELADHIKGNYLEVVPTAEQFVEAMPKLIYHMDEPVAGPGLFPQYCTSKLASQHVKVVLGGQGGDEIFGGYARYLIGYLEQALKGAICQTQEEGSHIVTLQSIIPNLPTLQQYFPLMRHFWGDGLFGEMGDRYFRLIDRTPDIAALLQPDCLDRYKTEEVYEDYRKLFTHADTLSYLNKMMHFDQKTLLPALLQVEDRVSMAVSIEARVPLLDKRIVDLVTSMPPAMKFQGGHLKHILKKVMGNLLPKSIMTRQDKMGFPVPLKQWMAGGPVRNFIGDTLLGKKCRQRGIFNPDALEKLIDRESAFGRQLWGALCLELWHQQFIDK